MCNDSEDKEKGDEPTEAEVVERRRTDSITDRVEN